MSKMRSSAAYRIAFAIFTAFALGLALLGFVVFEAMHVSFTRELDNQVQLEAQTLVEEYRSGGNAEVMDTIAARERIPSHYHMLYAAFGPDGRRLYGSLQTSRPGLGQQQISFVDPGEGPDLARAYAVDLGPGERLVVAADRDWIEHTDRRIEEVFALAFLAACAFGVAGAAILGLYLRRRLQAISLAAEAIGGDVRSRIPVGPRGDEFDQVSVTLNRMLDRIEGLLDNLRQVSSDIAHDLRTPLARLRTRLEAGLLEANDEKAAAVMEQSMRQIDEALSLFAAILRIAEVESGETRRLFAPVDVSSLATELAESYAPAIADGGRELVWSVDPGLMANGDRELLAQAGVNLIENAQNHTPPGTRIRLEAKANGNHVRLQVADDGPGVPERDLVRIVKRFARLDTSRNKAGYGLGLNLVSAVATLHGGRLTLKNCAPGLVGILDLPALPAGSAA